MISDNALPESPFRIPTQDKSRTFRIDLSRLFPYLRGRRLEFDLRPYSVSMGYQFPLG